MLQALLVELWVYLGPILLWNGALGLLNLLLTQRSRIDAWAEAHPKRAAVMKAMRGLGWDPWHLVAAATLWVKRRLPDGTRPPAQAAEQPRERIYLTTHEPPRPFPDPPSPPRPPDDDEIKW